MPEKIQPAFWISIYGALLASIHAVFTVLDKMQKIEVKIYGPFQKLRFTFDKGHESLPAFLETRVINKTNRIAKIVLRYYMFPDNHTVYESHPVDFEGDSIEPNDSKKYEVIYDADFQKHDNKFVMVVKDSVGKRYYSANIFQRLIKIGRFYEPRDKSF
jgi:hypothetical protein